MIERGVLVDDFEDDEEGQSEEESDGADENEKSKTKTATGKNDGAASGAKTAGASGQGLAGIALGGGLNAQTLTGAPGVQAAQINDFSKILVAGEGFGKEYLKNEIDRLIKILQDKQSVGLGVHTFVRVDGPRKGWEEDNN